MLTGRGVAPPFRIPEQKGFGQIRGHTVGVAMRQGVAVPGLACGGGHVLALGCWADALPHPLVTHIHHWREA